MMLLSRGRGNKVPRLRPAVSEVGAQGGDVLSGALRSLVFVARQHGLHLTTAQLVHDNVLVSEEVNRAQLLRCARAAGLRAELVQLDWAGLMKIGKAVPAILILRDGTSMVLLGPDLQSEPKRVLVQDPNCETDAALELDRLRLESAWAGEIVLIKRNYEISDETQPFGFGLVRSVIFRERRLVADVVACAAILSLVALAPIVFWRLIIDRVLMGKGMSTFVTLCTFMIVIVAFETIFSVLRRYLVSIMTTRADVKLSTYMFEKVMALPVDYFEKTPAGQTAFEMSQIWRIRNFMSGQLFGTVLDAGVLLVFFPVMFFFSPILTLVVFLLCAAMFLWIVAMLPAYRRRSSQAIAAESAQGSFLIQSLNGIRTIKSLALDARQRKEWDIHVATVAKHRFALDNLSNLIQSVVLPIERLMVSGTIALGVYFAVTTNDPVFVGALFAFMMLTQRVAAPLVQLAQLINQYDEARSAIDVVGRLVNQAPEEGRSGHGVRSRVDGAIEFSNVTFRYSGAISPALKEFSFEIPVGTTLGIMGRSGSGKTTVTRLLQRLNSNYSGLIKIDGIDVREYDLDHLRTSLGVVLQENFLFSGTIRDNITASKPNATFEEVVRAARLAGAEEFIDKLPRGYETYIYEGSPNLSGGQRQRLAIARALITDPRILILDEATSALDAESEAIVNANLARIAHGRTVIIISHRLSSLVRADAILVMERGQVHDIGRHAELLERCEIYSHMWHQQNGHLQEAPAKVVGVRRIPHVA